MKWIFTAEKYTASDAFNDGVVDFIVKKADTRKYLDDFVIKIIKNAPLAVKVGKQSINQAFINHGFKAERNEYIKALNSEDRNEGLKAFKDKTTPKWKNK